MTPGRAPPYRHAAAWPHSWKSMDSRPRPITSSSSSGWATTCNRAELSRVPENSQTSEAIRQLRITATATGWNIGCSSRAMICTAGAGTRVRRAFSVRMAWAWSAPAAPPPASRPSGANFLASRYSTLPTLTAGRKRRLPGRRSPWPGERRRPRSTPDTAAGTGARPDRADCAPGRWLRTDPTPGIRRAVPPPGPSCGTTTPTLFSPASFPPRPQRVCQGYGRDYDSIRIRRDPRAKRFAGMARPLCPITGLVSNVSLVRACGNHWRPMPLDVRHPIAPSVCPDFGPGQPQPARRCHPFTFGGRPLTAPGGDRQRERSPPG